MNVWYAVRSRPGSGPPDVGVGGSSADGSGRSGRSITVEGGFTLVELVVAVLILAVGLLGLAGTTAFVVRQTTLAEVTTERSMAFQSVVEAVRARPYASVASGSETVGPIEASWSVTADDGSVMTVEVVTLGPGLRTVGGFPTLADQVADTFYLQRINH